MRRLIFLLLTILGLQSAILAQAPIETPAAEQTIQPSQSTSADVAAPATEIKIPGGTSIEVQVAYTVRSVDVKVGERISFRVLVPIVVDGVTVIQEGALVTARVTMAKRGGHWGKAGKLAWNMEDVVAADSSLIPLSPETSARSDKLWSLETRNNNPPKVGQGTVTGTSHVGQVAAMTAVMGVLSPPIALMNGFKRGEDAILREGRRYIVTVGRDTIVKVTKN
ncbi:MAG TPA: hypothetical protein VLL54_12510 [Pyrinomonadaceae bacterium]|nr:hypothetical protein [Pyrinomonadaceae bacterium]